MLERILIAGSGGQGIVLVSKLLAKVAATYLEHVTFFPSYGAEVRGGTSHCQVVLSSNPIASPVSEKFDSLIIMNQLSLDRFYDQTDEDALILINSSLCSIADSSSVMMIPATDIAVELGNVRAANFVMLGAYVGKMREVAPDKVVSQEKAEAAIRAEIKGKDPVLVDLNVRAFREGTAL